MGPCKVNISLFSALGIFGIIVKQVIRQCHGLKYKVYVGMSHILYGLPVCVVKVKDLNYCQSTFHNFRGDRIRLSPAIRVWTQFSPKPCTWNFSCIHIRIDQHTNLWFHVCVSLYLLHIKYQHTLSAQKVWTFRASVDILTCLYNFKACLKAKTMF